MKVSPPMGGRRAVFPALPLNPSPGNYISFSFQWGVKTKNILVHTHTQREGVKRSQPPKRISGFKNAQAALREMSPLGLAWVALAGRERQGTGTEFRSDWKVDKKGKPMHSIYT